jgi:hypothetical protein
VVFKILATPSVCCLELIQSNALSHFHQIIVFWLLAVTTEPLPRPNVCAGDAATTTDVAVKAPLFFLFVATSKG